MQIVEYKLYSCVVDFVMVYNLFVKKDDQSLKRSKPIAVMMMVDGTPNLR